jgi:hypothetical protein
MRRTSQRLRIAPIESVVALPLDRTVCFAKGG